MEEQKFSLGGSFRKTKEYIDSQLELVKLKAVAKGSRIVGSVVLAVTKVLFAILVVFFWAMALGFYLSYLVDNYALGFLITGAIFALLIVIISLANKSLQAAVMNLIIRTFLDKWHEDDARLEEERLERMKRKAEEAVKEREVVESIQKVDNVVNEGNEHK